MLTYLRVVPRRRASTETDARRKFMRDAVAVSVRLPSTVHRRAVYTTHARRMPHLRNFHTLAPGRHAQPGRNASARTVCCALYRSATTLKRAGFPPLAASRLSSLTSHQPPRKKSSSCAPSRARSSQPSGGGGRRGADELERDALLELLALLALELLVPHGHLVGRRRWGGRFSEGRGAGEAGPPSDCACWRERGWRRGGR